MIIEISAIWCNSCLVMKKVWKSVKEEYQNIKWKSLDLDFDEAESKYQNLEKLPVLIFEKNGKEVSRLVGEKKKEEAIKWIEQNLV